MPDIHSIRLREPWTCEPRGAGVCWIRSFNWPAGLTPREKVWVVIEPLPDDAQVSLNGQALTGNLEITKLIGLTNRLEIELPNGRAGDFPCQVRLDIDEG
ncbi:MAG: hypothetical protein SH868_03185 [Bythopirellula sp.]|nr:hypothetical protein [Bythopirellula sp.]